MSASFGPRATIKRSCFDCAACQSESYAVQGDSGHKVYCAHPSLSERKRIGDTTWDTPAWCPVAPPPSPLATDDSFEGEEIAVPSMLAPPPSPKD